MCSPSLPGSPGAGETSSRGGLTRTAPEGYRLAGSDRAGREWVPTDGNGPTLSLEEGYNRSYQEQRDAAPPPEPVAPAPAPPPPPPEPPAAPDVPDAPDESKSTLTAAAKNKRNEKKRSLSVTSGSNRSSRSQNSLSIGGSGVGVAT